MPATTFMVCSAGCALCCCCCQRLCCDDGMSLEELAKSPPTTLQVQNFVEALQTKSDPDGEPDVCCFVLPKSIVCCLPRCFCPCICRKPDPVTTVKTDDVVTLAKKSYSGGGGANGKPTFLSEERAVRYTARLFQSSQASECRLDYMSAGLTLLSIGTLKEKVQSLFDSFSQRFGGRYNREALETTIQSVLKTALDIFERVAEFLASSVGLPGGKTVGVLMKAMNGTVGSVFVKNKANRMLQNRDLDKDGTINFDEFFQMTNRRDSLLRKLIMWVDQKTKIMRGDRSKDLTGLIKLNDKEVWARVIDTTEESKQFIEYWNSEEDLGKDEARVGRISLAEPCSIDDGDNEDDNIFTVRDKNKKVHKIETLDRDSFFEWYDAVDDKCEAKLDPGDLDPDDDGFPEFCPVPIRRMLR